MSLKKTYFNIMFIKVHITFCDTILFMIEINDTRVVMDEEMQLKYHYQKHSVRPYTDIFGKFMTFGN